MSDSFPTGLHFYWYERTPGEEQREYWGQLCGSMHRLVFVWEELQAVKDIRDIDLALERLAYHMENYLVRVYEMRERAAKLLAAFAKYGGDIRLLKARGSRQDAVRSLPTIDAASSEKYLALLSALDEDIDLRNQNTHDTFLSLGYSTGYGIYDPHDALIDVKSQSPGALEGFSQALREEIDRTVQTYGSKIDRIIEVTRALLEQLDYVETRKVPN